MTSTAETFRDFGGKDSEPCHDCGTPLYPARRRTRHGSPIVARAGQPID